MASMNEKDYYAILEVSEDASTDEIRRAFQKKARKLHPDVNKEPDAEERFKEVSEAYAVLSDDDKRKRYDAMRSGSPFAAYPGQGAGAGYGSPFDGFPFGSSWGTTGATKSRSYRPRAGSDVKVQVDLDAQAAQKGVKRGVTYQRYVACDVCHGNGSVEHTEATTCPTCGGAGRMRIDLGGMGIFGVGFFEVTCPECEGSGKVVADPCTACNGSGRVLSASELVVEVPENSHDGDEVRVAGMGNAGTNGREYGDFVCRVGVAEERVTQRQEAGFRLIGFAIPFVVIGILQPALTTMTIAGAIMAAIGLAMVISEGVRLNARWLREGGVAIVGGASTGIIIGLLLMFSGPFLSMIAFILPVIILFSILSRRAR